MCPRCPPCPQLCCNCGGLMAGWAGPLHPWLAPRAGLTAWQNIPIAVGPAVPSPTAWQPGQRWGQPGRCGHRWGVLRSFEGGAKNGSLGGGCRDPWDRCIEAYGVSIGPCDTDVPMGCVQLHGVSMAPWSTDGIIRHPWNIHGSTGHRWLRGTHDSMEHSWLQGTHLAPWDTNGSTGHSWVHGTQVAPCDMHSSLCHLQPHGTYTALVGGDSGDRSTFPCWAPEPEQVCGCWALSSWGPLRDVPSPRERGRL